MTTSRQKQLRPRRIRLGYALLGLAAVLALFPGVPGHAQEGADRVIASPPSPTLHALVVAGINGDPQEIRDKAQAVQRLHRYFGTLDGVQATFLVSPESPVAQLGRESTRANLLAKLESLANAVQPGDEVLFYFVGQANIVGEDLRLNLPGSDVRHRELVEALAPLAVVPSVIVLDCPGAGMAVKPLTHPGRIVIAAARSDQPHSTRFSSYFVPALSSPEGDVDGDGHTSLLEAFQWSAQQIDALYRDQGLMKNETPILEDDADGEPSQSPWRFDATGKDGKKAAHWYFDGPGPGSTPPEALKTAAPIQPGGAPHETNE